MPTIMPKSVFYHIPKTGGTWVSQVLVDNGGAIKKIPGKHPYNITEEHSSPKKYRTDKFTFAFVRHPVDWYKSMWKFRKNNLWEPESVFDVRMEFEDWVEYILKAYPGVYSDIVREFSSVDYIGRQENLKEDLKIALDMAGEDYDPVHLERDPANRSGDKPRISNKLRKAIIRAEPFVMKYYES